MKTLLLIIGLMLGVGAQAAITGPGGGGGGGSNGLSATQITNAITASGIKYIGPAGGDNGIVNAATNRPSFDQQFGISKDWTNSGGGSYLWAAFNAGSSNRGWGAPIYLPAWGGSGSPMPYQPAMANIQAPEIRVNGNPGFASRTNIVQGGGAANDSSLVYRQYNPYGHGLMYFPSYTTNIAYNYYGSGTYNSVAFTNSEGTPVFVYDTFGYTAGSIHPDWTPGVTNQSGSYVIILGGRRDNPFHISENTTGPSGLFTDTGGTSQHPLFTIDRRGNTNSSFPFSIGFPMLVRDTWEPTQSNFRWTLASDPRYGTVYITNGLLTVTNIISTATNFGANVFGGNYYAGAINNLNGPTVVNMPSQLGFDNMLLGIDAATAAGEPRLAFALKGGDSQPHLVYGTNSALVVKRSIHTGLLTGSQATSNAAAATTFFIGTVAYFSNIVDFAAPVGLGVKANTIAGAGNGNTNYTLQATHGKAYLGSSNVNIVAVMSYTAGTVYNSLATITNLSASTWGITFSAVTNRWRFSGPANITNSPSVLTNGTALRLRLEIDGTNILCDWNHYAPGL